MKNDYEVRGETTAIMLRHRQGFVVEALIDSDDLELVSTFPGTWCCHYDRRTATFAVVARNGRKQIRLHRLIVEAQGWTSVHHGNRNGLDNRRGNLRKGKMPPNLNGNHAARKELEEAAERGDLDALAIRSRARGKRKIWHQAWMRQLAARSPAGETNTNAVS